MTDHIGELRLEVRAQDADVNGLDTLASSLRDEVLYLDVESVERVKGGPLPKGAMGVDWIQVGELVVELAPVVVPSLVTALTAWIKRQYTGAEKKDLKINIEYKKLKFVVDLSTTQESAANIASDLASNMQAEQKK